MESSSQIESNSTVFDASQYAFFGNNVVDEVELGGLDDEEDEIEYVPPVVFDDREEVGVLESLPEVDLAERFSELNSTVGITRSAGIIRDGGSRESSSAADWARVEDLSHWYHQRSIDAESSEESQRWPLQQNSSSVYLGESQLLFRTSSYPEQQQQPHLNQPQNFFSEPILVPKSSFTSYPPPGDKPQKPSPDSYRPL